MAHIKGYMDIGLFMEMLEIDSTSSKEAGFSSFLAERFCCGGNTLSRFDVGDGTENILFSWGKPDIVFCSHLDTVPPYIPPVMLRDMSARIGGDAGVEEFPCKGEILIKGRGSCDAKGQIFSMYTACRQLEEMGESGFGLLLLSGEETGSFGAKDFRKVHEGGRVVIVGEPTDNMMVSASKGTKSFEVTLKGKSFHSGYPEYGRSAVDAFADFLDRLRDTAFPEDPLLGRTTWNIGRLVSDNPQNVLSDSLKFRIYFRTTFASDAFVTDFMCSCKGPWTEVEAFGGDTPSRYLTLDGLASKTVAFGSDAPQLSNFREKILCGPGSILVAHRPVEFILAGDLEKAAANYVEMFKKLKYDKRI